MARGAPAPSTLVACAVLTVLLLLAACERSGGVHATREQCAAYEAAIDAPPTNL
ncbi:MAG TPA: hypothetical protein VLT45_30065 [Kofleriaceae bacterium]|nr:hypothetical protein [Kofleriaceae bacterium]